MPNYTLKCAVASIAVAAMAAAPIAAKKADSLRDLIGASGAGAETQLANRGFEFISGDKTNNTSNTYWWHQSDKDCIRVSVTQGRVAAINDAKASDCGKKSGNDGAIAAAAIGALLFAGKDKDRHRDQYNQDWQQVEVRNTQSGFLRIFRDPDKNSRVRGEFREGTLLRNYGCDRYNGEVWCDVTTLDNRTRGWARDRYLRVTDWQTYPQRPGGGSGGGWGGSGGSWANFADLNGSRAPGAQNTLRQRGFRNVDGFRSGATAYTIWFRESSRQCIQMAVADGRVDSIVDIHNHPRCR